MQRVVLFSTLLGIGLAIAGAFFPAHQGTIMAAENCSPAMAHAAGDSTGTITSGGIERNYILHVPPSYTGSEALPLVFNMHGLGSNARDQLDYTGLEAKADAAGFLIVAPNALSTANISLSHWNIIVSHNAGEADEVLFFNDLLDELERTLCVDASRVYATGMSNGAEMTSRLACSMADRIAAAAPVSGLYYPPLSTTSLQDTVGCDATRAMPIIAFHGTADPIIPFNGGPLTLNGIELDVTFRDMDDQILPDWAAKEGCGPEPAREPVTASIYRLHYTGCQDGSTIEMYVIDGGGHTWPDATRDQAALGVTTHEINADDLMWDFFQRYKLDNPPAAAGVLPKTGGSDGGGIDSRWFSIIGAAIVVTGVAGAFVVFLWTGRR